MKNNSGTFLKIALGSVALVLIGLTVWQRYSHEAGPGAPVDVGNIYDWNLYDGPLAQDFTTLVGEPLVIKSTGGYYVSRLANKIEYKDGSGTIGLRESVYWSDGVRMTADHVLSALERRQRNAALASSRNTEEVTKALAGARFKKTAEHEISFEGFPSEEAAYLVFTSLASGPIRPDLLENKKNDAWRVTVGAYYPAEMRDRFLPEDSVRLEPNQYYYQGKKTAPLDLKLHSVYLRAVKDAEVAKHGRAS
jgi:ABC-type transport system substrate-binding protein